MLIGGLFKKPTTLIIGKSGETEGVELMRPKKKKKRELSKKRENFICGSWTTNKAVICVCPGGLKGKGLVGEQGRD